MLYVFALLLSVFLLLISWKSATAEMDNNSEEAVVKESNVFYNYIKDHDYHLLNPISSIPHIIENEYSFSSDDNYLLYLPYEGMTNQFTCLVRGLFLAKELNRTLLIPPLFSSKHNSKKRLHLDWRYLFDFTKVNFDVKYRFLDISSPIQLKNLLTDGRELQCHTYGRWKNIWTLGLPAEHFIRAFNVKLSLYWPGELPSKERTWTYLKSEFEGRSFERLLCEANMQHLEFPRATEYFLNNLGPSNQIIGSMMDFFELVGIGSQRYGAVHWRRGDFELACRNKNITRCFPTLESLEATILRISRKQNLTTFIVGTNEYQFSMDMSEFGIDVIRSKMTNYISEEWNELAPVVMDTFIFTFADYFIGNCYSTVSRSVVTRRTALGLKKFTETF